jgi:hypothetical protein
VSIKPHSSAAVASHSQSAPPTPGTGVTVRSPDDFLTDLFDADPALVEAVTREAADNLTQSTPSWDEYLTALAERHGLSKFVGRLRSWNLKDVEEPARRSPIVSVSAHSPQFV